MRSPYRQFVILAALAFALPTSAPSQEVEQPTRSADSPPIDPAGIPGSLVICGGGKLPDRIFARFVELAGGDEARIVVIPTASLRADDPGAEERYLTPWSQRTKGAVTLLHTRLREQASTAAFVLPLKSATGVWLSGGSQSRIAEAYVGTEVESELQALRRRGGVIGGSSAGAAVQSRLMITGGMSPATTGEGFDFLPDAVIDQHFLARRRQPRLKGVLATRPGHFGLGIDEGAAVVVTGRRMRVLGDSVAHLYLPAGAGRPLRREVVKETEDRSSAIDLVTWQRAARERTGRPFPSTPAARTFVPSGTLILAGGGRLPAVVVERFIEAAGGPDAPIVVVPTAAGRIDPNRPGFEQVLARLGATDVKVLHVDHPSRVDGAENLDHLRNARGVWFSGGRQWRLVDAYGGTAAVELFWKVLERGGVIAGSSAGTSIQAEFMVRGNPLGNREMAVEGYERGFGFLPGAAVDQHFFQRNRLADMSGLMRQYPQLLGIGIDEGTAIVVKKGELEVVGNSKVAVYDWVGRPPAEDDDGLDHAVLEPGDRYDVANRRIPAGGALRGGR